MRALCPIKDHELREKEHDLMDRISTFYLDFNDWKTIESDGVSYELHIDAHLKRKGIKGPIEIDSFSFRGCQLLIHVPNLKEPVPVDVYEFQITHPIEAKRLENQAELFLLQYALASSDWERDNSDE